LSIAGNYVHGDVDAGVTHEGGADAAVNVKGAVRSDILSDVRHSAVANPI
jgi:hypothetical protein